MCEPFVGAAARTGSLCRCANSPYMHAVVIMILQCARRSCTRWWWSSTRWSGCSSSTWPRRTGCPAATASAGGLRLDAGMHTVPCAEYRHACVARSLSAALPEGQRRRAARCCSASPVYHGSAYPGTRRCSDEGPSKYIEVFASMQYGWLRWHLLRSSRSHCMASEGPRTG